MFGKPIEIKPELMALIEKARDYKMTHAEMAAQRKSWVKGEMMLEHEDITAEQFEALWSSIHEEPIK
jgi:hypothetical protein